MQSGKRSSLVLLSLSQVSRVGRSPVRESIKILYFIRPDGLVNLGYANFQKNSLVDNTESTLRVGRPAATIHVYIGFSGRHHLKKMSLAHFS